MLVGRLEVGVGGVDFLNDAGHVVLVEDVNATFQHVWTITIGRLAYIVTPSRFHVSSGAPSFLNRCAASMPGETFW
jgi:hypothetical protein